jgi:hypothetical protein
MAISSRHKQRPGEWRDVLATEVLDQYIGRHIAVIQKRVVAAGDTYEHVRSEAEKLFPNEMAYFAYIPDDEYIDEQPVAQLRKRSAKPRSSSKVTAPVIEN